MKYRVKKELKEFLVWEVKEVKGVKEVKDECLVSCFLLNS